MFEIIFVYGIKIFITVFDFKFVIKAVNFIELGMKKFSFLIFGKGIKIFAQRLQRLLVGFQVRGAFRRQIGKAVFGIKFLIEFIEAVADFGIAVFLFLTVIIGLNVVADFQPFGIFGSSFHGPGLLGIGRSHQLFGIVGHFQFGLQSFRTGSLGNFIVKET